MTGQRLDRRGLALGIAVFLSGGVLLGLEIVASRVLAPAFGSSLYVWGALIGVVEGYSTAKVTSKGATPAWSIEVPVPGQTYVTPLSDVKRFLSQTSYADLFADRAGLAEP